MQHRETSFEEEEFENGGPMETFEYIWVNVWYMLDWIIGFCHTVGHSGIPLIN